MRTVEEIHEFVRSNKPAMLYCKFDLRRDIRFNSRVAAAHYREDARSWEIELEGGDRYIARFLITAIGILSAATMPNIPGIGTFDGVSCHTHSWPKEGVDFAGKRVGIIGTDATAVQTIQEIAKTVGHLTVFQRRVGCFAVRQAGRHTGVVHAGYSGPHRNNRFPPDSSKARLDTVTAR